MIEAFHNKGAYFIVFELMSGGELFERLLEQECYSESEARKVFRPIVDAIRYCHNHGIIHRDLKPENLLYSEEDTNSTIKVSDFGLARILETKNQLMSTVCGTPTYLAPEVIKNEKYGGACDCWSLGVILYMLLCGYPPFGEEVSNEVLFNKIKTSSYEFPSQDWGAISDEAKDLISNLLKQNPEDRITAEQILKHSWMAEDQDCSEIKGYKERLKKYNLKRKLRRAQRVVYFSKILEKRLKMKKQ